MSIGVSSSQGIGADVRANQVTQGARSRKQAFGTSQLSPFAAPSTTPPPAPPSQPRVPPPDADPAFAEMIRQAEWQRRQQRSQLQFEMGALGPTFERALNQSRRQYGIEQNRLNSAIGASGMAWSSEAGRQRDIMRTGQAEKEATAHAEMVNNMARLADQIAAADRGEIAYGAESSLQWARDYMSRQLGQTLGVA